jgi:hypothetical protein
MLSSESARPVDGAKLISVMATNTKITRTGTRTIFIAVPPFGKSVGSPGEVWLEKKIALTTTIE